MAAERVAGRGGSRVTSKNGRLLLGTARSVRIHSEAFTLLGAGAAAHTVASTFNGADPDHRSKLTYPSGREVTSTLDSVGRLDTLSSGLPGQTGALLADYRHIGSQTSGRDLHYPGQGTGKTVFGHDVFGRLSGIDDAGTPFSSIGFGYDGAGKPTEERYAYQQALTPPRVGDRYVYDEFDRLTEAWLGLDQASMDAPTLSETTSTFVEKLTYAMDDAGNRTGVTRLDGGTGSNATTPYAVQSSSNRYDTVDGVQLTYDNRGNLRFDGAFVYVYDFRNRLSEVYAVTDGAPQSLQAGGGTVVLHEKSVAAACAQLQRAAGGHAAIVTSGPRLRAAGVLSRQGSFVSSTAQGAQLTTEPGPDSLVLVAEYGYDAFNRRVIRAVTETGSRFHCYDGVSEVCELAPAGGTANTEKEFVWGARLDELLVYARSDGQGGWTEYLAHQGRHESVVRLQDVNGAEVESCRYVPYGTPAVYVAGIPQGEASTVGNPYLWKGLRRDAETGLVYMRNRYYSMALGRFLTVDPIGVWGDPASLGNGYSYGANAPTYLSDPHGDILPIIGFLLIAAFQGATSAGLEHLLFDFLDDGSVNGSNGSLAEAMAMGALTDVALGGLGSALRTIRASSGVLGAIGGALPSPPSLGGGLPSIGGGGGLPGRGFGPPGLGGPGRGRAAVAVVDESAAGAQGCLKQIHVELPDDAFVVRGGVTTPNQIAKGTGPHRDVPGLEGFSAQSRAGASVEELAATGGVGNGPFPHGQISVSTAGQLRSVGAEVIPSPGAGANHVTVSPGPATPTQLSQQFTQRPNPARN